MALFTDGNICAADDLAAHDSGILAVASAESIDLTVKLGLAQDDLAIELTALLPVGDSLSNVVVTTPLRLWHAFHTLELVYQDAYYNQLNDRYAGKRDQFAALARSAQDSLLRAGVGMASNGIPKAGPAQLTYSAGALAGATYYVSTSWVGFDGSEGVSGDYVAITVPDNNVLFVQPGGTVPAAAAAWNVYAGLTPDTIVRQNPSPMPAGQPWLQQGALSTSGFPPSTGQSADYMRVVARMLLRG
jgi:hypothetical protein